MESGTTQWNLYYASPGQINALAGPLPASGTVPVTVVLNCGTADEVTSAAINVPVAAVAPEFLYFLENANGDNPVAAVDVTTNVYAGAPGLIFGATFAPVHASDVITAYGVGWGATTSSDPIGTLASAAAGITNSYSLPLGGMPVNVSYIGLSPGSAGLYQVNFMVPSGLAPGNQALVLTVDGMATTSNAFIAVAKSLLSCVRTVTFTVKHSRGQDARRTRPFVHTGVTRRPSACRSCTCTSSVSPTAAAPAGR